MVGTIRRLVAPHGGSRSVVMVPGVATRAVVHAGTSVWPGGGRGPRGKPTRAPIRYYLVGCTWLFGGVGSDWPVKLGLVTSPVTVAESRVLLDTL